MREFLIALYATMFVLAPIAGTKVGRLGGQQFTAGLIVMTVAFAAVDLVNNRWGKREARRVITIGLAVRLFVYLVALPVVLVLPTVREPQAYDTLLHQALRVFVAGEVATFGMQWLVDIPLFDWLKRRSDGRWLSLRYNVSNLVSLTLTSAIFIIIGFAGTGIALWPLLRGQVIVRVVLSLALTPAVALMGRVQWR